MYFFCSIAIKEFCCFAKLRTADNGIIDHQKALILDKLMYRDKVYREARRTMADAENVKIFFKGVNDTDSVKKRYKDLLKIYHPDNTHGDNNIVLAINEEYERLLRFYLGT